jgi:hypothetical protein
MMGVKKAAATKNLVIFLDADGVMNGIRNWPENAPRNWIDPRTVERLNQITTRTGAKLVISSSWRLFWDVKDILKKAGVTGTVIGETPYLAGRDRGTEIQSWLADHRVDNYVILDDDSDMGELVDRLIQTDWDLGLQDKHINQVVIRLNEY